MTYTENYNFALPSNEDGYDITPISENFETLDGILTENETAIEEISAKIGTPAESGQTLFSLLDNGSGTGLTAIKSIQYVTYSSVYDTTSGSVAINTVDPEKSIVLFERLQDTSGHSAFEASYTLNASSIAVTHGKAPYDKVLCLGFWVIEFC